MTNKNTLESQEVMKNLERELSFHIGRKLHLKFKDDISIRFNSSPMSQSRYVYAGRKGKGVGIRISDHLNSKPIEPKAIRYYTKAYGVANVRDFYIHTLPSFSEEPHNHYSMANVDRLVLDVIKYLE
jgi:hypothetical protein